jgi:hemolysin activation/secretion protein
MSIRISHPAAATTFPYSAAAQQSQQQQSQQQQRQQQQRQQQQRQQQQRDVGKVMRAVSAILLLGWLCGH